jgi:hypothetical protein
MKLTYEYLKHVASSTFTKQQRTTYLKAQKIRELKMLKPKKQAKP